MPTLFAFRLSTYLTLALSCLCVSYAEWNVLRQASYFGVVVLVLLGVAFWCEGRYELDLSAANRLGFVIGIVAAGWIAVQFVNKNSLIYTLPWPASLLPYLGPLLMILMPAKLFRPKHTGDWWAMQGIGLAATGLATAIEDDATFMGLLGLYAVAGVWSLSLFFYLRVGGLLPPVPRTDPGPMPTILASQVQVERVQFGGHFFGQTLVWVGVALAMALPLFFLTPRSSAPAWQFGRARLETGMTSEQSVDLNKSGELQVNRDIVYEVVARNRDGTPHLDLPSDQRFRYQTFAGYDSGRWQRLGSSRQNTVYARGALPLSNTPADFGPSQIELTFTQLVRLPAPVFADPVAWRVNQPAPVASVTRGQPWFQQWDGVMATTQLGTAKAPMPPYRQLAVFNPPPDRDLGPPFELSVPFLPAGQPANPENPLVLHRSVRPPRIREWSVELFRRLALTDAVLAQCLGRASETPQFQFLPQDYEAVARRLTAYFQATTEYEYTLKLRRIDLAADPVEEFLTRTREGHCERFAAGVALVLRSVGIPTQYVLGYKGCEGEGEDGVYSIRQDAAHAWVDVLVPRPAPPGFPFAASPPPEMDGHPVVWHWLSVDPTPGGDTDTTPTGEGVVGLWDRAVGFLSEFVIGYNAERRLQAAESVTRWVLHGPGRLVLLGIAVSTGSLALSLVVRARRRRPAVVPSGLTWFDRYLALVRESGRSLEPGATPRETAAALDADLGTDVASRLVARYYLARFAGQSVAPEELREIDGLLAVLRSQLTGRVT